MLYTVYGHLLTAPFDLPMLPAANGPLADMAPHIAIRLDERPAPVAVWDIDERFGADADVEEPAREGIVGVGAVEDEPWLRVGRSAGGFVLQFGQRVSFWVSHDAARVVVHDRAPLSEAVLHLLVDQVIPLALAHAGALVLHASGVLIDGRVVALFGPSGTGKSTLTGSLAAGGSRVLADDALAIELRGGATERVALACPAYPALRVWPDVLSASGHAESAPFVADYTEKRRVPLPASQFVAEPHPLRRLYLLEPDEAPSPRVVRLSKRAAVMAILTHSYVLDAGDAGRLTAQLVTACAVVVAADVRAISFPRDLDRLAAVRAALRRDLAT